MSEPIIRLENIGKSYDHGQTFAVRNVNLSIDKGDFVALLGPSGCGKSTTLMMLCGLYRPTEGEIYFNGKRVNNVPPKDRNIGMVFQSYALYPNMSVFENIAFPLRQIKSLKKKEINERVQEVARIVKIPELLERMPAQLSGGQQQRVAMSRALVKNPDILLLDEPMSNLDARLKLEVRDEIKKLQKKLNLTAIIVTHDQEEAMAISSHIAVIDRGSVQQYAKPDVLYRRPKNLFVASFIGNPPMNFIHAELEKQGDDYLCHTATGSLRVPALRIDEEALTGRAVVLGIRPHDLHPCKEHEGFALRVDYVEHLGKENLCRCYADQTGLRVMTPAHTIPASGSLLHVRPDIEALNLFDAVSSDNVTRELTEASTALAGSRVLREEA